MPPPDKPSLNQVFSGLEVYKGNKNGYNSDIKHHYYFCKKSSFNSHATLDAASDRSRVKHGMTGFTLAEVLITLGIIGIVAALTISTLIGNYQKKTSAVRLKKFYSTFSQALQLSEMEHGDITTWNIAEAGGFQDARNIPFFTEYLYKYMNPVGICEPRNFGKKCEPIDIKKTIDNTKMRVLFQDGSCMGINVSGNDANSENSTGGLGFQLLYDINCDKGPNKVGRDQFYFSAYWTHIEKTNKQTYPLFATGNPLPSNVQKYKNATRDTLKSFCESSKTNCAALIQYDNWEIKADYPW